MFCSKCGSEVAEETVFCPNCGAKIGEAAVEMPDAASDAAEKSKEIAGKAKENAKKWSLKKKIIAAAAAFLAIVVVVGMCNDDEGGSSGGSGGKGKNTIRYLREQNTAAARDWADFIEAYGINAVTEDGKFILLMAVQQENEELVAACIKDKADVNLRGGSDAFSAPPLMYAVRKGNYEITKRLLDAGALVHPVYEKDESHFDLFAANEFDALRACPFGDDNLKYNGDYAKVALLLIPYYRDNYKISGLLDHFDKDSDEDAFLSKCFRYRKPNVEIVDALIEAGYRASEKDITDGTGLLKSFLKTDGSENAEASETAWTALTHYLALSEYKERHANLIKNAYKGFYTFLAMSFDSYYGDKENAPAYFEKSIRLLDWLLANGYSTELNDVQSPDSFMRDFVAGAADYHASDAEIESYIQQIATTFKKYGISVN